MSTISTPLPTPPDNFSTQIASATVSSSAITFNVDDASGLPTEGVGVLFKKDSDGDVVAGSIEFIHWTGVSGNTINLSDTGDRGLTGSDSGAQAYVADDYFEVWVSSYYYDSQYDAFTAEHDTDGTHSTITATSVALGGDTALAGNASQTEVATGTSDALVVTPTGASIYGNSSMARQAIMNGNFDVWQRGTSFTASANNDDVYTADRWNLISNGNDVLDVSQEAITDLPGSNYAIKLDVETSAQAGIVQFLEAKDAQKFQGKTVSVSFAVKSANISAIRAAVLSWDSTADSVTSDVVGTWAATPTWATNWTQENTPGDLTVTSSWTTVSITGISVDTASMNNLALAIWLPNAETIGDIIYISQVQMCMGSVALPFQPKSFAQELADCQRYCVGYTVSGFESIGQGSAGTTTSCSILIHLPSEMRTTPTLTATAADFSLLDHNSAAVNVTGLAMDTATDTKYNATLTATVASGLTQFRPYYLAGDNGGTRTLILSAEL